MLVKTKNPSSAFVVSKIDMTGRWDPSYFQPELVALENRVRGITPYRLRDFVTSMSGGSTPPTKEAETHYTDNDDGVPFVRVQNLSTTGQLNLEDCKRITRSTHEGLLARSRLRGDELLVKITGVGRMAIASVVPTGFEGNINQHIVAIRTKDKRTSETIAAYLNLNLAERLASRRSTGGTRPALDYPALLSLPISFDERIPTLMQAAVRTYEGRMSDAASLLARIDDALLDELGITKKSEPSNTIASRVFRRALSEVSGGRLDPTANQERRTRLEQTIHSSQFGSRPLREIASFEKTLVNEIVDGESYIGLENVDGESGEFRATTDKESVGTAVRFLPGQLLFPKLRPYLNKTHLAKFGGICSTEFHVLTPHGVTGEYLAAFLRSRNIVEITSLLMTGNTLPRLQTSDIERLPIPVPPIARQQSICTKIRKLQSAARALRLQAITDLEDAKRAIEAMILGKESLK
jgi:hypothetical protein